MAQGFMLVRAERPYIQFELLVLLHLFTVRVINGREKERAPMSVEVKCACESVCMCSVPFAGGLPHRFIG